jgi:serine/threonine-protein kinase HipA
VRRLLVVLGDGPAGWLEEDAEGSLSLRYVPEWIERPEAAALSHSLPLTHAAYREGPVRTFFEGLLPEGPVREHLAERLGIPAEDVLALLATIGGDCAGAVRLFPPERWAPTSADPLWLGEAGLAAGLRDLPRRPLGVDPARDVRVCVAGAQDKLPVVIAADGRTGLARGGQATTHVLKVQVDGFEDTTVNEAFCMELARRLGLPTAEAALRRAEDVTYVAVRRHDRRLDRARLGPVRVHQEDVCQALALPPTRKYETQGGPTLVDCVGLIRAISARPEADLETFVRAVAFDYLIANNDAHGKNVSLLRDRAEGVRLAPLYDLGCTSVYAGLPSSMAMRIGAEESAEQIRSEDWRRLAEGAALPLAAVNRWLRPLVDRAPAEARAAAAALEAQGWRSRIPRRVCAFIEQRAGRLGTALADFVTPSSVG